MSDQYARIVMLERENNELRRRVANLENAILELRQNARIAGMGGGFGGGGSNSGGAYYADPSTTTIAANSSTSLTVSEIKASGDESLGSKTVINKYSDATAASKRLLLVKTRDDAYVVYGQACSTG